VVETFPVPSPTVVTPTAARMMRRWSAYLRQYASGLEVFWDATPPHRSCWRETFVGLDVPKSICEPAGMSS